MATAWRRLGRTLALPAVLAVALLAPAATLAADEGPGAPVTTTAVTGVVGQVGPTDLPAEAGPLLLLLVAGTLGLLGALSGPEAAPAPHRSVRRPHEHTR